MTKTAEINVFREPVDGVNRQQIFQSAYHFRVEDLKSFESKGLREAA